MSTEPVRVYTTRQGLLEIQDNALRQKEPFILGHSTIFMMRRRIKFIDDNACLEWPNLQGAPTRMTKGEAAKLELKREWPDLRRVGWRRNDIALLDKTPPRVYTGPQTFDGVYVDLKAAYWNIYRKLWLDTQYPRGIGTLVLHPIAERVKDNKGVRNSIIGSIVARNIVMGTKEGKLVQVRSSNPFLSPGLWATIQDILHELAGMAVRMGACYVATDGYIFPAYGHWETFCQVLDAAGFPYTIGQGPTDIRGWGSYNIEGVKKTALYDPSYSWKAGTFSNLEHAERSTLAWVTNIPSRFYDKKEPPTYLLKRNGSKSRKK